MSWSKVHFWNNSLFCLGVKSESQLSRTHENFISAKVNVFEIKRCYSSLSYKRGFTLHVYDFACAFFVTFERTYDFPNVSRDSFWKTFQDISIFLCIKDNFVINFCPKYDNYDGQRRQEFGRKCTYFKFICIFCQRLDPVARCLAILHDCFLP